MSEPVTPTEVASPNSGLQAITTFKEYLAANPIKAFSSAVFMWGALLLLVFFVRIGFMPDVNLDSVSSALYAVALLGLLIAAYTTLMLVLPGLVLASFMSGVRGVSPWHLLCISLGSSFIWAFILWWMFIDDEIGAWYYIVLCAVAICLLLAAGVGISRSKLPTAPATASSAGFWGMPWNARKHPRRLFLWSLGALTAVSLCLSLSLIFIGLVGLNGDIRSASNSHAAIQLLFLAAVIAFSAAVIGAVRSSDTVKVSVILAPGLLFLVLNLTGSFTAIPAMAMRVLGQGEIGAARIVVSGKTCREINETLGQRVCDEEAKEDATAVCPAMIKSRIGSQMVLDFAPIGMDVSDGNRPQLVWVTTERRVGEQPGPSTVRRVILDKSKIISWQPLRALGERDAGKVHRFTELTRLGSWMQVGDAATSLEGQSAGPSPDEQLERLCGHKLRRKAAATEDKTKVAS